jgi:type IV pilus assembly protein PilM
MASLFDTVLNIFSGKKQKSVVGVDIGSSSVKVVQLGLKKGRVVLETYGELALGPYGGMSVGQAVKLPTDKIVEAVTDVLKEANISTKDAAFSIPMRSSMVSVFKMPLMKESQLSQMVPIEARKYIPVPISEVSMDWFIVPTADSIEDEDEGKADKGIRKYTEVMTVAIHNDVISEYTSVVGTLGLNVPFFEVEMFSASRAVLEPIFSGPVMIVDIGAGASKVYVTEQGVVRDSHTIARGSQNITLNTANALTVTVEFAEKLKRNIGRNDGKQDMVVKQIADQVIDPILNEIESVILNYQRKYNRDITQIILIGGGSLLPGLAEKTQNKLGVKTNLGKPFDKTETPAFLSEILDEAGLAFAPAIGLALRRLQDLIR